MQHLLWDSTCVLNFKFPLGIYSFSHKPIILCLIQQFDTEAWYTARAYIYCKEIPINAVLHGVYKIKNLLMSGKGITFVYVSTSVCI